MSVPIQFFQDSEALIHTYQYHQPFGIFKYAMTLDGKIAATTGHSAWISSPMSRNLVHHLRASCDAVIVGGNTVRRDNPHLTTHGVSENQPLRVVMSRTMNLPEEANLWNTEAVATLVFTQIGMNPTLQKKLRDQGVDVVELDYLTPATAMNHLYQRGLIAVLWECGGSLAAQAISQGCVQKLLAFIAPKIIGGSTAPSPVGDLGLTLMTDALKLERVSWQGVGQDLLMTGYLARKETQPISDYPSEEIRNHLIKY